MCYGIIVVLPASVTFGCDEGVGGGGCDGVGGGAGVRRATQPLSVVLSVTAHQ